MMIQNNNSNALLNPQQNQLQQQLQVQNFQNNFNYPQINTQSNLSNYSNFQQPYTSQYNQPTIINSTIQNLLGQFFGQQNPLQNQQINSQQYISNNNQFDNINILQLLGLINPQPSNTLGSIVTNSQLDRNIPNLQDALQPSSFNLYGNQMQQQPSIAQDLTSIALNSILYIASPKWARNNSSNNQNTTRRQNQIERENQIQSNIYGTDLQLAQRNQIIDFKVEKEFEDLSKEISGDKKLAAYLQFIDNIDYSNFYNKKGQPVSNCEVIQLISPLDQKKENLIQCVLLHFYANLRQKQVCFIFSCKNIQNMIYFYKICSSVSPLDLENLNLDKKLSQNRKFSKSTNPNVFMIDTKFSLQRSINCNNSRDILKDISIVNVLNEFQNNQLLIKLIMVKYLYYFFSIFLFSLQALRQKFYAMSFKQIQFFMQNKVNSFIVYNILNVFIMMSLNSIRKYYTKESFFKGLLGKELINDITMVQNYFALYNSDYANHGIGRNMINEIFAFVWLFFLKIVCLKIMQAILQDDKLSKNKSIIPLTSLIIILTIIFRSVIKVTTLENIMTKLVPIYLTKSIITLLIGYIYYCRKFFKYLGISKEILGPFLNLLYHLTEILLLVVIISMWNILYLKDDFRFFEYFFFIYVAEFVQKFKIFCLALQFQRARRQSYSQDEQRNCTICLENMKQSIYLICGHSFHKDCIKKLIVHSKSTKCPYCGQQIQFWNDKEKKQFCQNRQKLFVRYAKVLTTKQTTFLGFKSCVKQIEFKKKEIEKEGIIELYNQIYQIIKIQFLLITKLIKKIMYLLQVFTKTIFKQYCQLDIKQFIFQINQSIFLIKGFVFNQENMKKLFH